MHDDAELIQRIRDGATDEFAELVRRHQSQVRRIVGRYELDVHLCDDLVQDTFLKAWRALASFDARAPFAHWLSRIAVRHLIQQAVTNPDRVRDVIEHRLVRQLDLSAAQRGQVHAILVDTQKDLHALRGEFRPQFVAIMSNAEQRVGAVLTDEQRARFAEFQAENRRFWEPGARP